VKGDFQYEKYMNILQHDYHTSKYEERCVDNYIVIVSCGHVVLAGKQVQFQIEVEVEICIQ
jgi:hypothetical protein